MASRFRQHLAPIMLTVLVTAVLAGVALPRAMRQARTDRASDCRAILGNVRAAIAGHYAREVDRGTARFPTLLELDMPGALLPRLIPPNPYTGLRGVRAAEGWWAADAPRVDGTTGWCYDVRSGRFWANSCVTGEHLY